MDDGVEMIAWVPASSRNALVSTLAEAAERVGITVEEGTEEEIAARAFVEWLAVTDRSWLTVFDDVSDPRMLDEWWPTGGTGTGWLLATTRRRDAAVTARGRQMVDVGLFSPEESRNYFRERFSASGRFRLLDDAVDALAELLGHLPLALSHAAAYMIDRDVTSSAYSSLFNDRRSKLVDVMPEQADAEGYGRALATTWSLSIEAANEQDPAGLALPAIRLASVLDPQGHPDCIWDTESIRKYLQSPSPLSGAELPRHALGVLQRFSLVDHTGDGARGVTMHALTQRAVIEASDDADEQVVDQSIRVAADSLLEAWPTDFTNSELTISLRANADALIRRRPNGALIWPEVHSLILRSGQSLYESGLYLAAIQYFEDIKGRVERILGPDHPDTLGVRSDLAMSYWFAGRTAQAIAIEEQVLVDRERILGSDHPDTLTARANLAGSYWSAGRTAEAIAIEEQVVADCERILGNEHSNTLSARANLATSYQTAGRTAEAISILEQVVADRERILGPEHPDTVSARANLATSYWSAGRTAEAIAILEQVVADSERILGPEHPDTVRAQANLAASYRSAGRTAEAIVIGGQVVADLERILGSDHPETVRSRANLAASYRSAGRTAVAIAIEEQVVADRERILGPEHPDTVSARANLATSYQSVGRTAEAIAILEQVVADRERILGPEHPDTVRARANLAVTYRSAGRTAEAIVIGGQVVADLERILGSDHPETVSARANLATSYWSAGRTAEAISILEQVVADSERNLGPEHPDTVSAQANLAASYQSVGRTAEAIAILEQVVADSERNLGPEHPDTISRRKVLGLWDTESR
jgi:tetratricopeptide (TPR) repeat protein